MENIELTKRVKNFWEKHPLCADLIPYPTGSEAFFKAYNSMRVAIIPFERKQQIYKFKEYNGKKVLDVGCGNGWVCEQYAKNGAACYGIDLTEKAIQLSRKRFNLSSMKASFKVADSQKLPFKNESFDLVTSMGVLHHVPDTSRAISEIKRVLKPGGRVLLMVYNKNSLRYRLLFPLRQIRRGVSRQMLINEFDGGENPLGKVYNQNEMVKMMRGFSGFEFMVDWIIPNHYPTGRLWSNKLSAYLAKRWGFFLYIRAVKV